MRGKSNRKSHRRKRVVSARGGPASGWDFRLRPVHLSFALVVLFALGLVLNPKPAEFTFDNTYRKLAHVVLHEESEYKTGEYVADIFSQSGEYNPAKDIAAIFENIPVTQSPLPPSSSFFATVLPAHTQLMKTNDSKWIEVDLSQQRLYGWENGEKKFEFLISSGKPWTPTLTGDFRIWIKLRYATMKGGSKERGDYYYLPNVPCVMYYDRGYGIHGAYWHNNFGQVMSHGCVNVKPDEVCQLFEWAGPSLDGKSVAKSTPEDPGTRVVVHN